MAQNHPQKHSQRPAPVDLSPDIIKQFLDNQGQQLLIEAEEFKLRQKELELSARQSDKALDYQAKYFERLPSENRKTITRIGWIVGLAMVAILAFVTFWLYIGQEEFAQKFLGLMGYVATTALGFLGGRYTKKKDKQIQEDGQTIPVEVED